MRIKDRAKFPPGHWKFLQPQTGWMAPMGLTFGQVVNAIIDHRKANPRFNLPTDTASVENELEQYTVARLVKIRGGEAFLTADEPGGTVPKASRLPQQAHRGASVVEGVKRKSVGVKVIMDWFGAGGRPVEKVRAERRATVCAACPLNVEMNLMDVLTEPAANMVRNQIEAKEEMKLETSLDEKLKVCGACDCHLQLKVWTPIKHIKNEMSDEAISRLDVGCWVLAESK